MTTPKEHRLTIKTGILANGSLPRTIPDRKVMGLTTFEATDPDTKFPPITPLRPPPGAPNVLVILLDDVGFGASSPFGGPCQTPTAERLAREGLKYTRFHTTAQFGKCHEVPVFEATPIGQCLRGNVQ